MLKLVGLLAFCLTAAAGLPSQQRIVSGSLTNISHYRFAAAMLVRVNNNLMKQCGGTIINNRSVLSAAHCFRFGSPNNYAVRVGSSYAHSGVSVYAVSIIRNRPNYSVSTKNNDITVIRISGTFSFGGNVQPGRKAGSNYNVGDNQAVWAIRWDLTSVSEFKYQF